MTSPITVSFNVETGLEDQKVIPIGSPSVIAGNSDAFRSEDFFFCHQLPTLTKKFLLGDFVLPPL
jgi:hypothetical protein